MLFCASMLSLAGCGSDKSEPPAPAPQSQPAAEPAVTYRGEVTLYTSTDEPFARMIADEFTKRTHIRVKTLFDTEADKTTGLARRIRGEAARPTADVFWSSEPFQMILLAQDNLLEPYLPPTAADIPLAYRDAKDRWVGFALRPRVLAYNPAMISADALPKTWMALADQAFADKIVLANPLFGTTRGHVAAMLATWGEPAFVNWVDKLAAAGIASRLAGGNAVAAKQIAMGQFALCATDSDDVNVLVQAGQKIAFAYPDMGDGGTLLLPNTAGLLKNAPHADLAKELVAFLCGDFVEEALAKSESGNIPVRPALRDKLKMTLPPTSPADYVKIAEAMPRAIEIIQQKWK